MDNWPLEGKVQYYLNDDPTQGYDNNRMSMQEFLLKRQAIGVDAFESEYQMNAVQIREGYLGFQNMRLFEWDSPEIPEPEVLHENTCAFFDQAFGDSNRADKNVISVVSEYDDNYYICEMVVWGGGNVFTKVEMVKWVFKRFPWITVFGVEAGEANAEDMRTIQEMLPDLPIEPIYQNNRDSTDADGITFPKLVFQNIAEIPATKRAKVFRIINQFSTTLPQGHFWMFQGIGRDQEELKMKMGKYYYDPITYFKDQWSFPFCAKFDAVDSVGSAKEMCQKGGGVKHLIWIHG